MGKRAIASLRPGMAAAPSSRDLWQRLAVYEHMLAQTRLRFLLADDAGAGKTIMAGLYIREMLARRLLRRVLIVPPAGLVGNWEREMRSLFSLPFRVVAGSESREEVNAILKSIAHELELR